VITKPFRLEELGEFLRTLAAMALPIADDGSPGALLTAALGFLQLAPQTPALRALHAWLDTWRGGDHIVVGMERQGLRLSLKKYGNGAGAWVAQFDRDVMTSAEGFGSGPTPWAAVQRAAWVAVKRIA
jgi:hypothetical protein